MRNLIIILLFSIGAYGQQDLLLASIQQAGGGITNLFPTGSAASPMPDEANSFGTWSAITATRSVVTGGYDGTYAIKGEMSSGGNGRIEIDITVTSGVSYNVSYYYKVTGVTTRTPGVEQWLGVVTSPTSLWTEDNTWYAQDFDVTTNSTTMKLRFYVDRSEGTGTGTILVDKVIVTPI